MNTSEVLQMIDTLKETGFNHIDVSHEGSHILLSNTELPTSVQPVQPVQPLQPVQPIQQVQPSQETQKIDTDVSNNNSVPVTEEVAPISGGHLVESPIVGTFYTAAGPDSEDFVKVGSKVNKGDVLCIIEAMKLMNEIEADQSGEIAEILVANEAGVEYGQPLFRIV